MWLSRAYLFVIGRDEGQKDGRTCRSVSSNPPRFCSLAMIASSTTG